MKAGGILDGILDIQNQPGQNQPGFSSWIFMTPKISTQNQQQQQHYAQQFVTAIHDTQN